MDFPTKKAALMAAFGGKIAGACIDALLVGETGLHGRVYLFLVVVPESDPALSRPLTIATRLQPRVPRRWQWRA